MKKEKKENDPLKADLLENRATETQVGQGEESPEKEVLKGEVVENGEPKVKKKRQAEPSSPAMIGAWGELLMILGIYVLAVAIGTGAIYFFMPKKEMPQNITVIADSLASEEGFVIDAATHSDSVAYSEPDSSRVVVALEAPESVDEPTVEVVDVEQEKLRAEEVKKQQFGTFLAYVISFLIPIIAIIIYRKNKGYRAPILRFRMGKTTPSIILLGFVLVLVNSFVIEPLIELFPSAYLERLNASVGVGLWPLMTVVIAAPIIEEVLFRGIIQERFARDKGKLISILVSASVFGLIHIVPQQVVNAFFIGIILGYIYLKTNSLIPVIIIHALNNGLAYGIMAIGGDKLANMSTREMISNDTLYFIIYGISIAVLVMLWVIIVTQFKKEKQLPETIAEKEGS